MLRNRLLTAAVLVLLAVFALSSSEPAVRLAFFVVFVGLAGAEFAALRWRTISGNVGEEMRFPKMALAHFLYGGACAGALVAEYFGTLRFHEAAIGLAFVFAWFTKMTLLAAIILYYSESDLEKVVQKLVNVMAGFLYIALPGIAMFKLASFEIPGAPRAMALFFALAIIFMGDTGAYFTGRLLGRHKLLPRVSPKKTIEGSAGGLVWSAATAVGLSLYFDLPFPWPMAIVTGLGVGFAGQVGDLVESAFKRVANCKDSSPLLPGHGGVLDRIDSLLLAAPLVYFLFLFYGYA